MIHAEEPVVPAFLVMTAWVGAEQHAAWLQTRVQFQQHARQLLAGYMKKRSVGEYAIEMVLRQIELEEILLPYFAAAMRAGHGGEARGAFQTYRDVAEFGKGLEVTPGPAAKIEYRETPFTLDVSQHRRDVLADVVMPRALPEIFGMLVIMFQREVGNFFHVVGLRHRSGVLILSSDPMPLAIVGRRRDLRLSVTHAVDQVSLAWY